MSALTKIFVVLLVVLVLLLVPGMVVFLNKLEDFSTLANRYKEENRLVKGENATLAMENKEILGDKEKAEVEAMNRAGALVGANQNLQSAVEVAQGQLAKANSDKAVVDTQNTTLTHALQQAQVTNTDNANANNNLRGRIEDLEKKNTESETKVSDANNKIDSLIRELHYAKEEIVAVKAELTAAQAQLVTRPVRAEAPGGGRPNVGEGAAAPVPLPAGVTIRGVVKNKFQVGDVSYATVSVGSADAVSKGAKFYVTDASGGQFLGYLIIDSVDPNEASGHLSGDNVQAVQKGSTVLSSWH